MTILNARQIADLVATAGFTGHDQAIAVAIALAESGGNPDIAGDTKITTDIWGPSIGLFQIRSLKAQRGTGGERDELANHDPLTNARHAHAIYAAARNTFQPWSTFNHGAFNKFLPAAQAALDSGHVIGHTSAVYIIQANDTLFSIARAHHATLDEIRTLNPGLFDTAHHNGALIHPGEPVRLPN